MSVEIPSALIRRVQAKLRKDAGVPSSYDPTDPSILSSLPTLDDALSDLDAAVGPSHPRCGKCRRGAGLLRGPKSTLCVFCGHDRRRDGVVQSISFNSTTACKKLLEFLHLDGSEVVNLNTESNDLNKGQDTQHDGLVLSTVLDLELKWPPEKEDEDAVGRRYEKAQINAQDVNFLGVDLDSFLSDSKNATVSGGPSVTSEELMPGKQTISTESHISYGPENFGSFNDFQTPSMVVKPENSKDGGDVSESFASWDTGFQSANSHAFHAESESVNHYLGSSTARPAISATNVAVAKESRSVDLFEHSPTVISTHEMPTSTIVELSNFKHVSGNKANCVEPTDEWGDFFKSDDCIQGDLWPSTSNQLKSTINTNDNELTGDVHSLTSAAVSWGEDEMWAPSYTEASGIKSEQHAHDVNDSEDALDSWQDFSSSKEAPGVSSSSWIRSGTAIDDTSSTLKFLDLQDIDFGDFFQTESSSGALAEHGWPNKVNDIQLNTLASTDNIEECLNVKSTHEIHDGDDAFDDALDSWQDFASSKETADRSSVSWIQWGNENTSNVHASTPRSVEAPAMEPGNFSSLKSFSGALAEQGGPSKVHDVQLYTSASTNNIEECLNVKSMHEIHDGDDAFDDALDSWQDFTSSKETAEVSSVSGIQMDNEIASNEHASTLRSVDASATEPGNFSQLECVFGALSEHGGPNKLNDNLLDNSGSTETIFNVKNSNVNSLEAWQDISSSNGASGDLSNIWTQNTSLSKLNEVSGTEYLDDMEFGSFLYSGSLSSAVGGQQDPSEVNARNLDPPVSSTITNEFAITNPNYDSLNDWQYFTSSKELAGALPDTSGAVGTSRDYIPGVKPVDPHDTMFDGFLHSGSLSGAVGGQQDPSESSGRKLDPPVSSTSTNEFDITKQSDDNDDSLDDWQDFTSSMESAGVLPDTSGAEGTSIDHFPGVKSVDPHYSAFDGFLHSFSLSGALDGQQDPSEVNVRKLNFAVSSTSRNEFESTKQNDDTDDYLDDWQDFTSSRESAGVSPNTSGAEGTSRDHVPGVMPVDHREANARKLDPPFSNGSIHEFDTTKWNVNNDDSLADWQEFTGAEEAPGVLPNACGPGAEATLRDHALGANSIGPQNLELGSFAYLDSFSGMIGKKASSYVNDIRLDASVSYSSKSSNIMNQNDGFIGSWKEFSGLNEVSQKLSNLSTQPITKDAFYEDNLEMKSDDIGDIEFGDFLQADMFSRVSHHEDSSMAKNDRLDTFVSTSSIKEPSNTKNGDDNTDPFDAWQDFIISNNSQRRSTTISEEPNMHVTSYNHLSGTKSLDLHDMEFGDLLHSSFLSGASSGKRSAIKVNNMQDNSISYRMNGSAEKVGIDSKLGSTNSTAAWTPDQDNLCIPKKGSNSNLKS